MRILFIKVSSLNISNFVFPVQPSDLGASFLVGTEEPDQGDVRQHLQGAAQGWGHPIRHGLRLCQNHSRHGLAADPRARAKK